MKSVAAGFPERRRPRSSDAPALPSGGEGASHAGRGGKLKQEYVEDSGRDRIDGQPEARPYTRADVKAAVMKVMSRLRPGLIPEDRIQEVRARLCSYAFESLGPQRDEIVVARCLEQPGAIGSAIRDFGAALESSVESNLAMLARLIALKRELPDPMAGGRGRAQQAPKKMISVRVTPEELERVKEEARLRSKSVSQIVRELLNFTTTAPAEIEYRSEFERWLAEQGQGSAEQTDLDP